MLFYRIGIKGTSQLVDNVGNFIVIADGGPVPPPLPPEWLLKAVRVRRLISDPIAADFFLTNDSLPDTGMDNVCYVKYGENYDANYWFYIDGVWNKSKLIFSDSYIRDIIDTTGTVEKSAQYLFNQIFLTIEDVYRVISENDGGQSMSFSSLSELIVFFKEKQNVLNGMIAMTGNRKKIAKCDNKTVGFVPVGRWS